jgi:hypothetical protein
MALTGWTSSAEGIIPKKSRSGSWALVAMPTKSAKVRGRVSLTSENAPWNEGISGASGAGNAGGITGGTGTGKGTTGTGAGVTTGTTAGTTTGARPPKGINIGIRLIGAVSIALLGYNTLAPSVNVLRKLCWPLCEIKSPPKKIKPGIGSCQEIFPDP